MHRVALRRTWLVCVLVLAALARAPAHAQTCGNPPTGVVAASSVCTPFTRIAWTNPVNSGLVFPKVWRNTTGDFATASLVYNPGLGGSTIFVDTVPSTGVNYFYWVGADLVGCGGAAGVTQSPVVGPLRAGVFNINNYPAPQAVAECDGIRVTWQPAFDTVGFSVARIGGDNGTLAEYFDGIAGSATSYLDTNVLPGNEYRYGAFPRSGCGNASSGSALGYVRAGPWANAAGESVAAEIGSFVILRAFNPLSIAQPIAVPPPTSYTWTRSGVPVANAGRFSGNGTAALSIANVRLEDAGQYLLTVERPCGGTISVPVVLAVTQSCRADFNQSGLVSVQDVFDFLTAFFAGCP